MLSTIPAAARYALAALILIGVGDAINKKARSLGIPVSSYLLVQAPCFCLTLLAVIVIRGGMPAGFSQLPLALAGTALSFAAFTLMLHSLTKGRASVNYAVFRMSFVFSSLAAIAFFGESFPAAKITGVASAAAAIALFSFNPGEPAAGQKPVFTALAAMALNSGYQIILKTAMRTSTPPPEFLASMSVSFLLVVVAYHLVSGRPPVPPRTFVYAPANGIIMALGTLAGLFSLSRGDLSTVMPIIQLSFIITAVVSVLFLKERLTLINTVGIVLAALSIVFLALG